MTIDEKIERWKRIEAAALVIARDVEIGRWIDSEGRYCDVEARVAPLVAALGSASPTDSDNRSEEVLRLIASPEWRVRMQEAISKSPTAFAASRLAVEIVDEMIAIATRR